MPKTDLARESRSGSCARPLTACECCPLNSCVEGRRSGTARGTPLAAEPQEIGQAQANVSPASLQSSGSMQDDAPESPGDRSA